MHRRRHSFRTALRYGSSDEISKENLLYFAIDFKKVIHKEMSSWKNKSFKKAP